MNATNYTGFSEKFSTLEPLFFSKIFNVKCLKTLTFSIFRCHIDVYLSFFAVMGGLTKTADDLSMKILLKLVVCSVSTAGGWTTEMEEFQEIRQT